MYFIICFLLYPFLKIVNIFSSLYCNCVIDAGTEDCRFSKCLIVYLPYKNDYHLINSAVTNTVRVHIPSTDSWINSHTQSVLVSVLTYIPTHLVTPRCQVLMLCGCMRAPSHILRMLAMQTFHSSQAATRHACPGPRSPHVAPHLFFCLIFTSVNAIAGKLLDFWSQKLLSWFIPVKAQFRQTGITHEQSILNPHTCFSGPQYLCQD